MQREVGVVYPADVLEREKKQNCTVFLQQYYVLFTFELVGWVVEGL